MFTSMKDRTPDNLISVAAKPRLANGHRITVKISTVIPVHSQQKGTSTKSSEIKKVANI